jgi:RND superfamily putative drug exporter
MAVAVLSRPNGLESADRDFARRLTARLERSDHPRSVLRVLGPNSEPVVAERLTSGDSTVELLAFPLSTSFVSPVTHEAVAWLQTESRAASLERPAGLDIEWTGDAVLGRDYMANVQTSLDRAAAATVALLLLVLLAVYRSVWLALVPLTTIGVSLAISRGLLAWMNLVGWEISSLVELFLIAVLFGSGTDFCLFVSWRFAERWNESDPAEAMRLTLSNASLALFTSAGTVIVGLSLMGTTQFKLFSSTGPSVALGLAMTLAATLTLTPALLVLLARYRPRAFRRFTVPASGFWQRIGDASLARPRLTWVATLLVMAPLAVVGLRTTLIQDLMSELPASTPSARAFRLIASKFEQGMTAPLTVVLESGNDLRGSEGLALIDDVSRYLSRQR